MLKFVTHFYSSLHTAYPVSSLRWSHTSRILQFDTFVTELMIVYVITIVRKVSYVNSVTVRSDITRQFHVKNREKIAKLNMLETFHAKMYVGESGAK